MSIVERLAKKYEQDGEGRLFTYEADARWWLRVIAEELDDLPAAFGGIEWPGLYCAEWLREEAEW